MDNREHCKGSYSSWLKKVKSDGARAKWLVSTTKRYFTIDFDAKIFFYSHSEGRKKVSQPIKFKDILGAVRLPTNKKKGCGFVLRTIDRTYELYTSTNSDAARWVHALNAAKDMAGSNATDVASALPVESVAVREPTVARECFDNENSRVDDSHDLADTTSEGKACSPVNEKTTLLSSPEEEMQEETDITGSHSHRPLRPKTLAPLFSATPASSGIVGGESSTPAPVVQKAAQSPEKLPMKEESQASFSKLPISPDIVGSDDSPLFASPARSRTTENAAKGDHTETATLLEATPVKGVIAPVSAPASPSILDSCDTQQKHYKDCVESDTTVGDSASSIVTDRFGEVDEEWQSEVKAHHGNIAVDDVVGVQDGLSLADPLLKEEDHGLEPEASAELHSSTDKKCPSMLDYSFNSELDDIPSPLAVVEDVAEVVPRKAPSCPKSLKELPFLPSITRELPVASLASSFSIDQAQPLQAAAAREQGRETAVASDSVEEKQDAFARTGNTLQSALSGTLPKKKSSVRFSEEAAEIVEVIKVEASCWEVDALDDEEAILASVEDDDASDWDSEEEESAFMSGKWQGHNLEHKDALALSSTKSSSNGVANGDGTEDWDSDEREPVTLNADPVEPSGWDSDDDEFEALSKNQLDRNADCNAQPQGSSNDGSQASKATSATEISEVDDLVGMVLAADTSVSVTPPFRGSEKYGFVPGLHCTSCDFQVMRIENYAWSKAANYMFFRNNYPNVMRLRKSLVAQKDCASFCCQCSWKSADVDAPIQVVSEGLRWRTIST